MRYILPAMNIAPENECLEYVGILLSFLDCLCLMAMLVLGSVFVGDRIIG